MSEAVELEAKFIIRRPEQVERALALLTEHDYKLAAQVTSQHSDRYFDTRDLAVRSAGWAYRCRRHGDRDELCLKSLDGRSDRIYARTEISQPLPDGTPAAVSRMAAGPVRDRLAELAAGERLHELFSVNTERTSYTAHRNNGPAATLRIDVDRTQILPKRRASSSRPAFVELEIEADDASTLNRLAAALHSDAGLTPARFSKFERGLQAVGMVPAAPQSPHKFKGSDGVVELLFAHLREQVDVLQRCESVAWEGIDAEGVHRMRVAIRRMRAILKTFSSSLAGIVDPQLDGEMRWLAHQLGHARDADVCEIDIGRIESVLPMASAIAPYEEHLRLSTADAYSDLVDAMSLPRYAALMRQLQRVVDARSLGRARKHFDGLTIVKAASKHVRPAAAKVRKCGREIDEASPAEDFHRLRLKAKKLRYLLDFFAAAQPRRWLASIADLKRLQDVLGEHQDATVASGRHAHYAESVPMAKKNRQLLLAMGRLLQIEDERIRRCRKAFPLAWSRFEKTMRR